MPKVFIGSTQKDLEAHRAAAIEACQRLQVVPIAMEEFGPDGRAPLEVCLAKVEQADFYRGLFAHRYVWIPEGQDRSITELEYEHAIARGLPVHLYVVDDECPWPPKWIDDGARKAKLADFKTRIGRRHTLRKFTDADSLKEDLLVYLPEALRALPAAPSSVPARRAPIPPAPALHAVPRYA